MEILNLDKLEIFGGNNGASLHCASITPSNIIVNLVLPFDEPNANTMIGNVEIINDNRLIEGQCVTTTINLWNFLKSQGSTTYVTVDTTKNPNGELRGNVESPKSTTPTPAPSSTTIEEGGGMPNIITSMEPSTSINAPSGSSADNPPTMVPTQPEESTDGPTPASSSSSSLSFSTIKRYTFTVIAAVCC